MIFYTKIAKNAKPVGDDQPQVSFRAVRGISEI
jgi:hypothetical protein